MMTDKLTHRWLAVDTTCNKTILQLKKTSHPNAEYDDVPYLEDNTLYIAAETVDDIRVSQYDTVLPSSALTAQQNIAVYCTEMIWDDRQSEIRFVTFIENVARAYEQQLCAGMDSAADTFEMELDACLQLQALVLADDAYGQMGFFDVLASPTANARLTLGSAGYFGDEGVHYQPWINDALLAKHVAQ